MKIDEAIRINEVLTMAPVLKDDPKVIGALKLGIEALKRVKAQHECNSIGIPRLLRGETEK